MGSVFFHIDLDAFFASVEILDHPEYRGKPLIIGTPGPRHVASTCSYEAREYGVRSAMPMTTALRLCPDAICVHGRMERYAEKSREVMSIISSFAPGFLQVSIDEAFLDLTGMERIYPLPGKAARMLKESIRDETGLTASIGVAPSRYLSKLASDFRKPDGLTIVPAGMEEEFIDAIPLRKLWGIGDAMLSALERRGLRSAAEIRRLGEDELRRMFGDSSGAFLYKASRGIDPGIYQGEARSRSISSEKTFYPDVYSADAIGSYLLEMSEEVMFRALDERKIPRTVGIKLRYGDFNPKKMEYNYALTHALSFNGNIQPTKNWRFNFNATYDFDTHKISYMTCNITRDLHCWQMSASFVPIGPYKSYTFNIAVSSSLLKDLKWRQSSNYRDGQTWY